MKYKWNVVVWRFQKVYLRYMISIGPILPFYGDCLMSNYDKKRVSYKFSFTGSKENFGD